MRNEKFYNYGSLWTIVQERWMIQIHVFRHLSFPLRTINKNALKAKLLCE